MSAEPVGVVSHRRRGRRTHARRWTGGAMVGALVLLALVSVEPATAGSPDALAPMGVVPGASAASQPAWTITTVAGNGENSNVSVGGEGDGGPATEAPLWPNGVAGDPAGNFYVAEGNRGRVRRVDASAIITTFAGVCDLRPCDGSYAGEGGPAASASIGYPEDVATDATGNVYIASLFNDGYRVLKVDAGTGIITTVAGHGTPGYGGDGSPATSASLSDVRGIAVDTNGSVFIADAGNARVRKVDADTGTITTVAGNGTGGDGGDGGPATSAEIGVVDVALDSLGNLYILQDGRVRKVDASGIITTIAGGGDRPYAEGATATDLHFQGLGSVATDPGGNLYVYASPVYGFGDYGWLVRRIDTSGTVTTVAGSGYYGFSGDGGPANYAQLGDVARIEVDPRGNLLIADVLPGFIGTRAFNVSVDTFAGRVRRVPTSLVWAVASGTPAVGSQFTYNLRVGPLPAAATGLTLTDTLPTSVTYRKAAASQGRCSQVSQKVTCKLGNLAKGAFATVAIAVRGTSVGVATDTATIAAAEPAAIPYGATMSLDTKISGANCGRVLTKSTTFTADIGPCAGKGLVIGADRITVDLGGHRLFGWPRPDPYLPPRWLPEPGGVGLPLRTGVTLRNGTVSGFHAGVLVRGGGGNTLNGLTIVDNVGYGDENLDELGDGILVLNSANNLIAANHVARNGIYDNIGVWGHDADGNTIRDNLVEDSAGPANGSGNGQGIIVNAVFDNSANSTDRGQTIESTTLVGNTVLRSASSGMANLNSVKGRVAGNTVSGSGRTNCHGNGIGFQFGQFMNPDQVALGTQQVVEDNELHGNGVDGIRIGTRGNTIRNNNAADNNANPAANNNRNFSCENAVPHSLGPIIGFDLHDSSSSTCETNTWSGNTWGTGGFNPACTATGGSGPEPTTSTDWAPLPALDVARPPISSFD